MKKTFFVAAVVLASLSLASALASGDALIQNVFTFLFQPLLQLVIVCSFVYFLYGVVRFIWAARKGEEEDMKTGKLHLLWGTIGLFILLSIGGILKLINAAVGGMF